jgi:hypothetical protein
MASLKAAHSLVSSSHAGLELYNGLSLHGSPSGPLGKRKAAKYQNNEDLLEVETAQRAQLLREAKDEHEEKYRVLREKNERTKQKIRERDEALHK